MMIVPFRLLSFLKATSLVVYFFIARLCRAFERHANAYGLRPLYRSQRCRLRFRQLRFSQGHRHLSTIAENCFQRRMPHF